MRKDYLKEKDMPKKSKRVLALCKKIDRKIDR